MKKVLVLLANGFEEIEAITCIDILRRAGLSVTVAGVGGITVRGAHDLVIKTDMKVASYNKLPDAIVLPGGMPGVKNLSASRKVNALVKEAYKKGKIIAAICAAPAYVLASTKILEGKKATCYPGCESMLRDHRVRFVNKKVVVDANIITSKGPGTAFEFALKLARILAGKKRERIVRKKTLYEK